MTLSKFFAGALLFATQTLAAQQAFAHSTSTKASAPVMADSHAPIGVMGDHMHQSGEWMASYRMMRMEMAGNLKGDRSIAPDTIASELSNPFAPPATARVVPNKMTGTMHMLGVMYAPNDELTLMVMANYLDKDMSHITYQGMMGTTRLGTFDTATSGWGDTVLGGLIRLYDDAMHHVHLNAGVSLPTGSIEEEGRVLTPMNTRMQLRLPYAMQLGSGSYELLPGITYTGRQGAYAWGGQITARIRLDDNKAGYRLGDQVQLTTWGSYRFQPAVSASMRLSARSQSDIRGRDRAIAAPVQTANPDNYGGESLSLGLGLNWAGQGTAWRGHRLAIELELPFLQHVHGVQMDMNSMLTAGYQYAL